MTKNAERILDMINNSDNHMTAEEIYKKLCAEYGKVVLATVYNNLNTLTKEGRIRRIALEGSPDHYDKMTRHDHLICKNCGAIADFFFDDITKQLEAHLGSGFESYDLNIHYLCPECASGKTVSGT